MTPTHRTHGRSLAPVVDGTQSSVREWALSGIWGREVHLLTDHAKYVARAGRHERAAVDVVEPVVDDAVAPPPRSAPAAPRRPRGPRPHAGVDGAGDPPAVHRRRRAPLLGVHRVRRHARVRPRRRSFGGTGSARTRSWALGSRVCCTTRCSRWKPPTTSSCGWATRRVNAERPRLCGTAARASPGHTGSPGATSTADAAGSTMREGSRRRARPCSPDALARAARRTTMRVGNRRAHR